MNLDNNNTNNPNNINNTENSLYDEEFYADMPDLISDNESEPYSETDYSDMPALVSYNDYYYYSDTNDLINAYKLELINKLCRTIQNTNEINQYISEPELETEIEQDLELYENDLQQPVAKKQKINNEDITDITDID